MLSSLDAGSYAYKLSDVQYAWHDKLHVVVQAHRLEKGWRVLDTINPKTK
jgi:hypothetical protein